MRLLIADSVFSAGNRLELRALLQLSLARRCYMDVIAKTSVSYQEWLLELTDAERTAWTLVSEYSARDMAVHRIQDVVVAGNAVSEWDRSTPRISVTDALRLISIPARILVENSVNDRAFILAMLPETTRRYFEWLEANDLIEFSHTGGVTELKNIVDKVVALKHHRRIRYFAIFDSDSPAPGVRHRNSERAVKSCERAQIPYHCLQRRAIENYLPKDALYYYANSVPAKAAAIRRRKMDAFYRLTPMQRCHFRMKSGFSIAPPQEEVALYAGLKEEVRRTLEGGIGADIADLYHDARDGRLRLHIEREGNDVELRAPIAALLALVRVPYA